MTSWRQCFWLTFEWCRIKIISGKSHQRNFLISYRSKVFYIFISNELIHTNTTKSKVKCKRRCPLVHVNLVQFQPRRARSNCLPTFPDQCERIRCNNRDPWTRRPESGGWSSSATVPSEGGRGPSVSAACNRGTRLPSCKQPWRVDQCATGRPLPKSSPILSSDSLYTRRSDRTESLFWPCSDILYWRGICSNSSSLFNNESAPSGIFIVR